MFVVKQQENNSVKDFRKVLNFNLLNFKVFIYICRPINNWRRGRVARLGSAKAPTAVRIRSMPQKRDT